MYFTQFDFTGDPAALIAAHDRLFAVYPQSILDVHLVVRRDNGITVYDACPDEATARSFATSAGFTDAVAQAGLPTARITWLGEIESIIVKPALVG